MTHPTSAKLPKDIASRILDRAASLDATDERIDLATLRSAAVDAGISPDAFERALVESLSMTPQVQRQPAFVEPQRFNFYEVVLKATTFGVAGGLLAIAVVSLLVGEGPDEDALLGAFIGGIGAIAGVFVYFMGKVRGRRD